MIVSLEYVLGAVVGAKAFSELCIVASAVLLTRGGGGEGEWVGVGICYNQKTWNGSFWAVSKPISASKY